MANKRTQTNAKSNIRNWETDYADGGVKTIQLGDEILTSMKAYIDYTLTDRALPYIDGLKPVHRAILWYMWENNARNGNNYIKSLSIAGGTISKLHPHSGDAAYLASAGLTRDKADDTRCGACMLNLSLIDGHGNFGASFEDSPAASRYTEQRLSKSGEACVRDATNGAVFMIPSFDAKNMLPEVAPIRLPLLLINGSKGLAYGYNVSWLPHNPTEAIKACLVRIDNPNCTIKDVKKVMPGPDFPNGGIVIDKENDGLSQAYQTGFGNILVTSRYIINKLSRGRHAIDIYETPYGVARSGDKSIVSGITTFAQNNPQYGITDVKNLSGGKQECLIEVTVKSGIEPNAVALALIAQNSGTMLTQTMSYRQSAVLGSFERTDAPDATGRTDMLRLTNPKPTDASMLDYLDSFISFRKACVVNSSEYERNDCLRRKHLIDGMLQALIDIDEVISTIRHSANKDTAKTNLKKKFKLDDIQADYILAIPLARLTRSDKIKLEGNSKQLANRAKELEEILSSDANVTAEVRRLLNELLDQQVLPRRTTIVSSNGKVIARAKTDTKETLQQVQTSASMLLGKSIKVGIDSQGNAKTIDMTSDTASNAHVSPKVTGTATLTIGADGTICMTDGKKTIPTGIIHHADVDKNAIVMCVFDNGTSIRMPVYELPTKPTIVQRKCVGIVVMPSDDKETWPNVAMVAASGKVKVLNSQTLTKASECDVMKLGANDSLLVAAPAGPDTDFVLVTTDARLLRFKTDTVNPQGRTSGGVAGMSLGNARLIGAGIATADATVLTSSVKSAKVTPLTDFPEKGRGTAGVRCQKLLKGEGELSLAAIGMGIAPIDTTGGIIEIPIGKRDASGTLKQEVSGYVDAR